ncbi:MAG: glycosyltransferase [Deltaproteobacteria bacterium]|nr:glycosyltransferase [Deltaproteobacteria bacterium]
MNGKITYPANIMHLVQGLEVGGLEHVVVSLIKGLDRSRYASSVCCFDTLGSLAGSLNGSTKVHLLKRKQGIDYAYPFRLAAFLKREKIQILHLHNSTAYFYGVIAGKLAGTPVVIYTEHARDVRPNMKVRVADRVLSVFTDRVVAVAGFIKKNLVEQEWFDPLKITIAYNGVDGSRFSAANDTAGIKKELGLGERSKVVGIVARLDPIKNHRSLIEAMDKVVKEFPDSVLLIIGDGPLRGELTELVSRLGLEKNIRLLGTRGDVERLLSIFDVFVLSSLSEGLPLTLLEAMASGRPIIATGVGGIPEVIENGVDGIIVPPGNTESLAKAITGLLNDRDRALKMGVMAKRKFDLRFSLDGMIRRYEEIYASF